MAYTSPKGSMLDALSSQRSGTQLGFSTSLQDQLANIYAAEERDAAQFAMDQAEIDNIARKMALRVAFGKTIGSALGGGAGATYSGFKTWDARGRPTFRSGNGGNGGNV